jgi:hypothetical protein
VKGENEMKSQRKSIVAILLLMLAFNLTGTALLVQADVGGEGKYLTIEFIGEGFVIATKEKSGQWWRFDPPSGTHKVGAGTVLLEPTAAEGYRFVKWIGDVNPDNTYKTEKYGVVIAVFEVLTYTITASVDLSKGYIIPYGDVTVTYGDSITFAFGPWDSDEYHVSTIVVDGPPPLGGFLDTYTFEHVTEDHSIHVCLDPIGTVSVPQGPGGSHNLDEFVGVTVDGYVDTKGAILGYSVIAQVPEGTSIYLYVIAMDPAPAITGEGVVYAFLVPEGTEPSTLTIVKGDSIQAIYSDVNGDLVVDSTDTSIVAEGKNQPYNASLDLDNDGYITNADIAIVNENKGTTLTDVTGEVVGEDPGPYFVTTIPMMDDDPPFRIW